mmetsp:Transcript_55095/g.134869  ORF Transcript_55095/g.134869 Transcript_55095/m.134869 type:complete len:297 (-) Transcript_55095:117-1007(-)
MSQSTFEEHQSPVRAPQRPLGASLHKHLLSTPPPRHREGAWRAYPPPEQPHRVFFVAGHPVDCCEDVPRHDLIGCRGWPCLREPHDLARGGAGPVVAVLEGQAKAHVSCLLRQHKDVDPAPVRRTEGLPGRLQRPHDVAVGAQALPHELRPNLVEPSRLLPRLDRRVPQRRDAVRPPVLAAHERQLHAAALLPHDVVLHALLGVAQIEAVDVREGVSDSDGLLQGVALHVLEAQHQLHCVRELRADLHPDAVHPCILHLLAQEECIQRAWHRPRQHLSLAPHRRGSDGRVRGRTRR